MTTRRQFLVGAAATVGSLTLAGCGSLQSSTAGASSDPIIFGVSGPFTGDNAEYGLIWKKAWAIALDEINGKGGINDAALIVQQAKAVGINATIFAAGSAYSPRFLSLAGNAANGVILPTTFLPDDPRPNVQKFVQTYKKRYNEIPDSFAEGAYDALNVLAWAVAKGGATRMGIQQTLLHGTDIPSLQYGPFKFGADRRVASYKSTFSAAIPGVFPACYQPIIFNLAVYALGRWM